MDFLSSDNLSNALQHAIKARVESKPPDTPITTELSPICFKRPANAVDWISSISE